MTIDEIIEQLLTDYANDHYYDMYDIIPDTASYDGLYVGLDKENEPKSFTLQFDYPNDETTWVTCEPNADVIRGHIEDAIKRMQEIISENFTEPVPDTKAESEENESCIFCAKFAGGKVACATEEDAMNGKKQNYQYIDIKFCPVCGRKLDG